MQPSCATAACGMHPQEWGPVEGGANISEVKRGAWIVEVKEEQ